MRNEALKNFPLLALLPKRALQDLLDHSTVDTYRKGTVLFQEGGACESVYRIISGRCESYHVRGDGTLKHLAILGPGDFLGDPDLV